MAKKPNKKPKDDEPVDETPTDETPNDDPEVSTTCTGTENPPPGTGGGCQ